MKACAEAEDKAWALSEAASVGGRRLGVVAMSGGSVARRGEGVGCAALPGGAGKVPCRASKSVTNPICFVITHIFEIISNKWFQQSHNGTIHFHLMAFVSHTYLLCTIIVTTLLHDRIFGQIS